MGLSKLNGDIVSKIVFFGDSITQALSVDPAVSFARQIGVHNGYAVPDIINAGLNGNKSADMLARLQADVLAHSPDVCVFMPMHNDANHSVPLATFAANVNSIIGQMRSAGIKVVVISPPLYRGGSASYVKFNTYLLELEQIVDAYQLPYIDLYRRYAWEFMVDVDYFVSLYEDAIHQSAAGYNYISNLCNSGRYDGFFVTGENDKERALTVSLGQWAIGGQSAADLDAVAAALSDLTGGA